VTLRAVSKVDAEVTDVLEKWTPDALLVQSSIANIAIADLALLYRLPAVSPNPGFVNVGGLISYSADFGAVPRRCAAMIAEVSERHQAGEPACGVATKILADDQSEDGEAARPRHRAGSTRPRRSVHRVTSVWA
jgi:hypothetical protein